VNATLQKVAGGLLGAILISCSAGSAAQQPPHAVLAASVPAQQAVNLYDVGVDGARLTLKKSLSVGKNPGHMCAAPNNSMVYVATATGASAIDVNTQAVTGTFADAAIKSPFGCIVSRDGAKLYVTDREANAVFIFATASRQLVKKLDVPEDPRQAIFTPDGKSLVVSCGDASELAIVDPATDTVKRTIKTIALDPRNMVITPDHKYLVVAMVSSDILSWYHADTLEYMSSFGITRSPQGMVAMPGGDRIFVSGAFEGAIGVVDVKQTKADGTPEPRQATTIPVGPAYSLAASSDGNYLYAAPTGDNASVVDLRFWKVSKPPALKGATTVLYLSH